MFALMKSRMSLKLGQVGSETKSLGQILEKPCVCYRGHISVQYALNLVRTFALIKSWMSLKMGHIWSKTRSLGQFLGKPCVCPRGHIFSLILMKLGQTVCLDDILEEFYGGSWFVKY